MSVAAGSLVGGRETKCKIMLIRGLGGSGHAIVVGMTQRNRCSLTVASSGSIWSGVTAYI